MPACGAIPGLFFCLAGTVLLVFVCVSVPTWDSIYFMQIGQGVQAIRFGTFGFTGSETHVGYEGLELASMGLRDGSVIDSDRIENLSKALIIHPIAAGFGGLTVLFGLCGTAYHRSGTIMMTISAVIAALLALVAWVIDMVLFGAFFAQFRDADIPTKWGNAPWLSLGATVAFIIAAVMSCCGIFGSYRKERRAATY
ncbi:hypothetical protein PM082_022455 [Marasmius tenuissimus]|nr:hypothetical protein PM082_022455 [Marasmius tenuissimus]